jgi:hypothetical protein
VTPSPTLNAADPSSPDTFYRRNLPRVGLYDSASDTGQVALATGVMTSVPIHLRSGDVVTNISFGPARPRPGTPTNYWLALYDSAATPALLAQSADQTSTAWAANTTKTLALSPRSRSPGRASTGSGSWSRRRPRRPCSAPVRPRPS